MELLHILFTAVNAVMPIILMILLGYILKAVGFLTEEFLRVGNKLMFNICLPCMLFINVYDIESFSSISWDIVIYAVAMLMVIFVLGLGTAIATTRVPERRGVILQCVFRSNFAIIGLSLAGALGGEEAMGVAAIVSAFTVPVFNILAVISLSMFMDQGSGTATLKKTLVSIGKNPLIIGCALGMVCLLLRLGQEKLFGQVIFRLDRQTKFLYTVLENLKNITTPLALLVLGGQFEFTAVRGLLKEIAVSTLWRIVLSPLLGIGGAILISTHTDLLQCGVNEFPALIAMFGSPVAVSSAIMAGNMKNDEQLATQLVVWTSLLSIVTIFATVCLLMWAGLLAV